MSSLQNELLRQASHLSTREPKRPKQASLRRSISGAYYALFHLLTDEATRLMLGSVPRRRILRLTTRRAFAHNKMSDAAKGFASGNVSPKMLPGLNDRTIQVELKNVAKAFVELQQARYEADYDVVRVFNRSETRDLVEQAERAFSDWKEVRKSVQADSFLMSLLVLSSLKNRN